MREIIVGLVEDKPYLQQMVTQKLELIPNVKLVLTANNGQEACDALQDFSNIDILFMDIQMPVLNGIEATKFIKAKHPQVKIIMLTVFDDDDNILKAIQAGANGYLLKEAEVNQLEQAIADCMNGGASLTPSIAHRALNLLRSGSAIQPSAQLEEISLTDREQDVLTQLSKGLTYKSISANLYISPATVRKHIENIYKKLQVHNKVQAIDKARKNNLL